MPTAEQLQKLIRDLFPGLMGVEIREVAQDKIVAGMLVRPDLCTTGGVCHGGSADGLRRHRRRDRHRHEPAGGRAHHHHRSKTNFMGPAPVDTRVTAESVPLHRGRTTQVWQTSIRSEAGKLIAVITQTQMVLPKS